MEVSQHTFQFIVYDLRSVSQKQMTLANGNAAAIYSILLLHHDIKMTKK